VIEAGFAAGVVEILKPSIKLLKKLRTLPSAHSQEHWKRDYSNKLVKR